jgi:hypothetical protein
MKQVVTLIFTILLLANGFAESGDAADVKRHRDPATSEVPDSSLLCEQKHGKTLLRADRTWVGPMPFKAGRLLRDDFFSTISNPVKWPTVLRHTDVFKSYIMILPEVPIPGKQEPELSDHELKQLVSLVNQHCLKVAFEVGGLRIAEGQKARRDAWGKQFAAQEFAHLKRWLDVGGRIDYLTADHPVMMNLGHRCYQGTDCGLTLEQTLEELADYYAQMALRIPGVRFGTIESLGFFHVTSLDGVEYPRTVPKLPVWHFEEFFDLLLSVMARRGLELDHFHIDYGFDGVRDDARRMKKADMDFGRLLGVERYVQSKGVRSGVIVNAFHDRSVANPHSEQASREAYEHTVRFHEGYLSAGGRAEHIIVQTWHPYPDHTGPEDKHYTVMNIARDLLLREDLQRPRSQGHQP